MEREIPFSVTFSCAEAGYYMLNGAPLHITFWCIPVWINIDCNSMCFTNFYFSFRSFIQFYFLIFKVQWFYLCITLAKPWK